MPLNVEISTDPDFDEVLSQVPNEILLMEGLNTSLFDVVIRSQQVKRYGSDISIDANSNAAIGKLRFHLKDLHEVLAPYQKLLNLNDFFVHLKSIYGADEAKLLFKKILLGDLYLHDPCFLNIPYCYAMSVCNVMTGGIKFNKQLLSVAPRHTTSFISQVAETVIAMSQELAGAVAISDIFVYYSHYLFKDFPGLDADNLPKHVSKHVENNFQHFVHILNAQHRFSGQSAFTNMSILDYPSLEGLFGTLVFPDDTTPNLTLVMKLQKIFCEWFAKGQLNDDDNFQPYPFPVVTFNIKVDAEKQIIDEETFNWFCRTNKNGNFNFFVSDTNKLASCCRVVNNLNTHMSIFGDGGVNIGSLRVVTINLARVGHRARKSNKSFIELLDLELDKAYKILMGHRSLIEKRIADGSCPFFADDLSFMFLERFFLTFGINGLYEGLLETGLEITTPEGLAAAQKILQHITDYVNSKCDVKRKILFNLEQVPGESLANKHAKKDRLLCGMPYDMYANQFVPLWKDIEPEERLRIDGALTPFMSGGCITHLNLTERVTSAKQTARVVRYAIECGCEHFAINYAYNTCASGHHSISGKSEMCPRCAEPIIRRITRIVGYFTAVEEWSPARKVEYETRIFS
ncbi:hypothetical protein HK102_002643 [Quaeritorhiza haematococci]|nr:hypothetical protein HK102_002643 [Quaeritorhiza haematococci]